MQIKEVLIWFEIVSSSIVQNFDSFMMLHGFKRSEFDSCVYIKFVDGSPIYLLLYVDDMLIAAKRKKEITTLKKLLSSEFEMKDLGAAKKILGMEITRDKNSSLLFLSQQSYIKKVLHHFNMHDAKSVSTPIGPVRLEESGEICERKTLFRIKKRSRSSRV